MRATARRTESGRALCMAGKRPSLNPAHREIAKTYIHRMTALASVELPLYKDFENRPRVAPSRTLPIIRIVTRRLFNNALVFPGICNTHLAFK